MLPEEAFYDDVTGKTVPWSTLDVWVRTDFTPFAKQCDVITQEHLKQTAITTRQEAIDRWAEQGAKLQEMGMRYLEEHGVTNARAALAAVVEGFKMEQSALAVPLKEWETVKRMSNEELIAEFVVSLGELRAGQSDIIDITPIEEEEEVAELQPGI